MTETILKYLVCICFVFFYLKSLILPQMGQFNEDRQILANVKIATCADPSSQHQMMEMIRRIAQSGVEDLRTFLPAFDLSSGNPWTKIEAIEEKFAGKFTFKPAPTFTTDEKILRWPFSALYRGSFAEALQLLKELECEGQLVRIRSANLSAGEKGEVTLEAAMELLFLDTVMATSVRERMVEK
ncbi:MAG: hypothetical protein HQM10_23160 [Candidatus Riflebacteria bacterium]|nr:hypothetical protein [Candidatus Riflebacteria bacterium]